MKEKTQLNYNNNINIGKNQIINEEINDKFIT